MPLLRDEADYSIIELRQGNPIDTEADWRLLLDACDGFLLDKDLDKLRITLQDACKTIIVERPYYCKDYRDTYTSYYAKKFASYPRTAVRLLFFESSIDPKEWWNVAAYAKAFIGYSVIRPTRINSIGRTILKPEACHGVKGFMCTTRYEAHLLGTRLEVAGFPYMSQDSDVTVCAHIACWMCLRYFSERYTDRPETYPYQITQLTSDVSNGRLVPSNGVQMSQVSEMFSRYGLAPEVYSRSNFQGGSFLRTLYAYVESGIPVVVGLAPDHAVTAFGHISDFTSPENSGLGVIWSSQYATGLVVNDDNAMPYQVMLEAGKSHSGPVSTYTLDKIDSFVVPLHEKVHLAAEDVELLTMRALRDPRYGLDAASPILSESYKDETLVIRQFLTTARAYREERCKLGNRPPAGIERFYATYPMSRFIWVSELTTRELYEKGQQILGEIIWDATAAQHDRFAFLLIHYPEMLFVNDRHAVTNDRERLAILAINQPLPYPAYRHNLKEIR